MGISNYGLWKGTPTSWNGTADTDHGHLEFTDGTANKSYEADVNIMSSDKDKRLVYWFVKDFNPTQPAISKLQALSQGFSTQQGSDSLALDFLREGFLTPSAGTLVSHNPKDPTETNDILTYLDPILSAAVTSKDTIYLWGSKYSDSDGTSGIHDIHMNQGNSGSFEDENGTYQDGGIVIESASGTWQGIFLAFATEAEKTDSKGDPDGPTFADALGGDTTSTTSTATARSTHATKGTVGIEAALVNPKGPDHDAQGVGKGETVYVQNKSAKDQSLQGWTIETGAGGKETLGNVTLSAHCKRGFEVPGAPLGNRGGKILLKDAQGETISEVNYTEKDARKEGRLVYFA
ncbi:hypothetical protein N0V82_004072 [Gnomoniopsis sp. IMI 355080]|nr:hypothetical protein N0V82_004072 [Gnomoniopsis sp. IMI 355080]